MMVMFDQADMKGEASGNAVRKVMQGAMDTGKVNKANKGLAPGQRLNFTDGKGEFGGTRCTSARTTSGSRCMP